MRLQDRPVAKWQIPTVNKKQFCILHFQAFYQQDEQLSNSKILLKLEFYVTHAYKHSYAHQA